MTPTREIDRAHSTTIAEPARSSAPDHADRPPPRTATSAVESITRQ